MPTPPLPPELAAQLAQVPTSASPWGLRYAPCRVRLSSGAILDRVYVVEETSFRSVWGDAPRDEIAISDVVFVEESPYRLPPALADKLYEADESGMGYTVFVVRFRDGTRLPFVTGNAVDFPNWPPGVSATDVVDVEPHAGRSEFRDRGPGRFERSADYVWCLYST